MKVLSLNISALKTIFHNGKEEKTGYFKTSVDEPIFLGFEGVKNDSVEDRLHHGGKDKACYMYSFNHYNFWKNLYPNLDWNYGMFGENITVENLNEANIKIGNIYKVGTAVVQVTQPRQPCYKMGIKFDNQNIVDEFRNSNFPGVYFRVLEEGFVNKNDEFQLIKTFENSLSVLEIFKLIYSKNPQTKVLKKAFADENLAENVKKYLKNKF